ncbi:HAD family hydrolase [Lacrimispora sp. NSJ-141]|uniref:HAD family hydrolase n=1 Tax=Lientehia hominis TaxID=2897778 RepID=A0AAP2RHR8_9FIRM|nr:HAD family hydrolase [Lientehia hominis]MCD2491123.1 HAD family hydrolase [Lientehia hominis]
MAQIILFDLDGTLTDPKEGITRCVQYGMEALGYAEPDLDRLTPFIGPPLKDMFMEYCGFEPEQADEAVKKYRERFSEKGMYENEIYEGIEDMLRTLKESGRRLGVATSKPWVFAEPILRHFGILDYFEFVTGSELSGERVQKSEVIEEALRRFGAGPEDKGNVFMVGDRKHDIFGALKAGVVSVGVTYGYGGYEELSQAGAGHIVDTVEELTELLLKL